MENAIHASESVPQSAHKSQYFHVKVVLVAQNSCTESAKLRLIRDLGEARLLGRR